MDDKNEQIYSQYALNINNVHKSKGIVYLDTKEGYYMIKSYNYTEYKIITENKLKEMLETKGYGYTDMCVKNKTDQYISYNKYMNKYIMKRWFIGEECDITNEEDVCRASANLARIHKLMQGFDEEQLDNIAKKNLIEEYTNHISELKRVKKYLYNKKKKNRLELDIIKSIDYYYKEAQKYLERLEQSAYNELYIDAIENKRICHGAYTHHSVLLLNGDEATINFDKMHMGVQIYDLYTLLRKTLEKNNWDINIARKIIKAYEEELVVTKEEKEILIIMLSYPEKYRKLINSYYNGKKSWLSIRIYEKLNELVLSEAKRQELLSTLYKEI